MASCGGAVAVDQPGPARPNTIDDHPKRQGQRRRTIFRPIAMRKDVRRVVHDHDEDAAPFFWCPHCCGLFSDPTAYSDHMADQHPSTSTDEQTSTSSASRTPNKRRVIYQEPQECGRMNPDSKNDSSNDNCQSQGDSLDQMRLEQDSNEFEFTSELSLTVDGSDLSTTPHEQQLFGVDQSSDKKADSCEHSFTCPMCAFWTADISQLTSHLADIHMVYEDDRSLVNIRQCSVCDYACVTESLLRRHIGCMHSSNRRYKCPECDFSTAIRSDLERHKKTSKHGSERHFQCLCVCSVGVTAFKTAAAKQYASNNLHGNQRVCVESKEGKASRRGDGAQKRRVGRPAKPKTEESRAARRKADVLRKAQQRANETEESRDTRRKADARRRAERRANEIKESRAGACQGEEELDYNNAPRRRVGRPSKPKTEESSAARREADVLRKAQQRASESEDRRAARLEADARRKAELRANESGERRAARLESLARRAAQRLANETEESRAARLAARALRRAVRQLADDDSEESRAARLEAVVRRQANRRAKEKPARREARRPSKEDTNVHIRHEFAKAYCQHEVSSDDPHQASSSGSIGLDNDLDGQQDQQLSPPFCIKQEPLDEFQPPDPASCCTKDDEQLHKCVTDNGVKIEKEIWNLNPEGIIRTIDSACIDTVSTGTTTIQEMVKEEPLDMDDLEAIAKFTIKEEPLDIDALDDQYK